MAKEPPENWGKDRLTQFQSFAHNNEFASFEYPRECFSFLIELNECLWEASYFSMMHSNRTERSLGFFLFVNAHNHFLASVRLLSSGQCLSAYPVGRASIESALYGWSLITDPKAENIWLEKPKKSDLNALRKWNDYFKFGTLATKVRVLNNELGSLLINTHQLAIDFGAHPNTDALYSNLNVTNMADGGQKRELIYLHRWNSFVAHAYKFTVETGIIILELVELGEPDFNRLMKLSEKISNLKVQFHGLMPTLEAEIKKPE